MISPTLVQERLATWGRAIRAARLHQRITVIDLCERAAISEGTLRRLESGDTGTAAGTYLGVLLSLGLFDVAAPPLSTAFLTAPGQRVRHSKLDRGEEHGGHF